MVLRIVIRTAALLFLLAYLAAFPVVMFWVSVGNLLEARERRLRSSDRQPVPARRLAAVKTSVRS